MRGLATVSALERGNKALEQVVGRLRLEPAVTSAYMRLLRGNVPLVLDKYGYKFKLGKAQVIRDGKDVLVISSGILTMRALEAAEELAQQGIDVAVLHTPTIKPLDVKTIRKEAQKSGRLVIVAENHTEIGGL